jgi:signal transduction histidine kinase/CheY-like chemotaxis protein
VYFNLKFRIVMPDGRIKWIWSRNFPVYNEAGEAYRTVGISEDITEQKALEAQLAQTDRLSSMGMLAAGVAHEINNPLAYVLYNLESLAEDLPDLLRTMRHVQGRISKRSKAPGDTNGLDDAAQQMNPMMLDDITQRFEHARSGAVRIRDIARGLATFSRVDEDKLVPVSLAHVIDVATNMAFNEVKYRARLVKDYGKTPMVLASEGRLSQVFLNLIINATHAIEEGDVDRNEIRVRTWVEGDKVFAEIRDTGKGIALEHLDKLFEPFFTTKELGTGSGLGLAITKNIIASYGGSITVSSELGRGTCFKVCLPALDKDSPRPERHVERKPSNPARGRILVVDDEEGIRIAIKQMLRDHETVDAASGAEAKSRLEADQNFDLILCDMMMPDVSGMAFHEWLSKRNERLAGQLVFMTGGVFTPKGREYLSKMDNLRIEKPFDRAYLKKLVGDLVRLAKIGDRS